MPTTVKTSVELVVQIGGDGIKRYVLLGKCAFSVAGFEPQLCPLLCYVLSNTLINHSVPQFPRVQRENNNSTHHMKL